jgi:hypothetical protein
MLAEMMELSWQGAVVGCINLAVMCIIGYVQWSQRRMVGQNEKAHDRLADENKAMMESLRRLETALQAERDARRDADTQNDKRSWEIFTELTGSYPKRREMMRLFGTLISRMAKQHDETVAEIKKLPCTAPQCPTAEKRN